MEPHSFWLYPKQLSVPMLLQGVNSNHPRRHSSYIPCAFSWRLKW